MPSSGTPQVMWLNTSHMAPSHTKSRWMALAAIQAPKFQVPTQATTDLSLIKIQVELAEIEAFFDNLDYPMS